MVSKISHFLGSKRFFYVILVLCILQALWYSLSFVPWINDEVKHFRTTQIFSEQASPFISEQPSSWDDAGQITRNGSYVFYYGFSWVLKAMELLTPDTTVQLVMLRILMIPIFIVGLILLRRALLQIRGFTPSLVHFALLLFVLTPAAGLLPGTYNYDTVVFALFAGMLLVGINVINNERVQPWRLISLFILAGLLILIKWSAVALVLPLLIAILYLDIYRHKASYGSRFRIAFARYSTRVRVALLVGLAVVAIAIIERPVQNVLLYAKAEPRCDQVLGKERCMTFIDFANYQATLQAKDPTFVPLSLPLYVIRYWAPYMADKSANLIEQGGTSRLNIIAAVYLVGLVGSVIILLARIRYLIKNRVLIVLGVVMIAYVAALIIEEYGVYMNYGIPGAIRTRYLVPILPLYIGLVLYALWPLARRYKRGAITVSIVLLVLMTQGGSIITHLFTAPPYAYLSKQSYDVNQTARRVLDPVIYDE